MGTESCLGSTPDTIGSAALPLARTSSIFILILLASCVADYLSNLLFGRWLGHVAYGDFGVAVSLALLLANAANLGTDESVPRFVPAYLAADRHGHVRGFLQSHLLAIGTLTLLVCLVGYGYYHFARTSEAEHPVALIWWIVPLLGVANFLYHTLANHERSMVRANVLQMVFCPVFMLCAGYLLLSESGLLTGHRAVIAYGVSVVVLLPFYGYLLSRTFPGTIWRAEAVYDLRTWAKTALPMIITTLVYYTLGQTDIYVMEHVGDEEHVGILLACVKTSDFAFLSFTAVSLILSPRISPLVEAGRTSEIQTLIRKSVQLILALSSAVAVLLILFGKPVLALFGREFVEGYPALVILTLGNVVIGALSIAWPLLSYGGHERVPVPGLVVALVLMVVLAELTIPRFGLLAAALCKTCVLIALFAWLSVQLERRMGIRILPRGPLSRSKGV